MLFNILRENAETYPDQTALVYGEQRLSYQALLQSVIRFAEGLNELEIDAGDCVAILLPNCPEFAITFYATASLGAIALPLNHLFQPSEIDFCLSDSRASVIVTDRIRAPICQGILKDFQRPPTLIVTDPVDDIAISFSALMSSGHRSISSVNKVFADAVLYQYSSGSTGRPKRISRTQWNLYHEALNFAETVNTNTTDNILNVVPLYHAHGLGNCLLASVYAGATLVILEPYLNNGTPTEVPFLFRRSRVLQLLAQEAISILPAVPYILSVLADTPDNIQADLSALRLCFSAGNFLPEEVFKKFADRFGVKVSQLYGCTEAGSLSINLDPTADSYNSVGSPLNNVDIKIVDEKGLQLPNDTVGEVVVRSQALTEGYHNQPKLNQEAFRSGWHFTGDLGKLDVSGRLLITGRKKILIDTGGRKVDPIEVEDVLLSSPAVKEAVVVGVSHPNAGEIVKAVVIPESHQCDVTELIVFCESKLATYKVPKIIEFRAEIPKSPLGKILRKSLV